jgi:hypothetical protein
MGGSLGFTFINKPSKIVSGQSGSLSAALIPNNDNLSIDLVSVALSSPSKTEAWTWYNNADPDRNCYTQYLLPPSSSA